MDFSLNEDQRSIQELVANIFARGMSIDRLREIEAGDEPWDRQLWQHLASAGLLGLALPQDSGGSDLGFIEICVMLVEQAKRVAPVPLYATLVLGALPIAKFGNDDLRQRFLPGVVSGSTVLTAALEEPFMMTGRLPVTVAVREGSAWKLNGTKINVPYLSFADRVVVPARVAGDTLLFLVDPKADDVRIEEVTTTDRKPAAHLFLDNTTLLESDVIGDSEGIGREYDWLIEHAMVALCAIQAGVAEAALSMTADYTSQREQFGKRISTFQGVAIRAANSYVDVKVMYATMWQAAWRLATGREAAVEVEVAKWWSAEAGQRVVHECQHLHGGIGADIDYPVHRYFLWAKHGELSLGAGQEHAYRLGQLLAS